MESLGYVLMYFLHGSLPWEGLRASSSEQKNQLILDMKTTSDMKQLCKDSPGEFDRFFNYLRGLQPHERPNYRHLRTLLSGLFARNHYEHDNVFDWTERLFSMKESPGWAM